MTALTNLTSQKQKENNFCNFWIILTSNHEIFTRNRRKEKRIPNIFFFFFSVRQLNYLRELVFFTDYYLGYRIVYPKSFIKPVQKQRVHMRSSLYFHCLSLFEEKRKENC